MGRSGRWYAAQPERLPRIQRQEGARRRAEGHTRRPPVSRQGAAASQPGAYQPCLVYDETRSFEAYLPCHEPSRRLTRMMQLIYESGVGAVVPHGGGKKNKGGKGYFDAVRVGPTLKIFTDTIVTEVDW